PLPSANEVHKVLLSTIVQGAQAPGIILAPGAAGKCPTLEEGQFYPCMEITKVAAVEGVTRRYSIQGVRVDYKLLEPFHVNISPVIQKVKCKEMEQMKSLNSKFVDFIDKVQCLQQTKPPTESLECMFEQYIAGLKKELEYLQYEKEKLQSDSEKKVNQHVVAEKEIIEFRKDENCIFSNNAELERKVSLLEQEIKFLKCVYTVTNSPCGSQSAAKQGKECRERAGGTGQCKLAGSKISISSGSKTKCRSEKSSTVCKWSSNR
ncbi:hypothetical protein E2320_016141, partial [Naja naja]